MVFFNRSPGYRSADQQPRRFLGVDPARGKSKAPRSWNRYAYVQGNPLKFIDPNGRDTTTTTSGASFGDPVDDWDLVWNSTGVGLGLTEILLGVLISSEDPEHGTVVEEMGEANVEKRLASLEEDLADATAPVGRRGATMANTPFQPVRDQAALIDGRTFTGHALDQMQNRGIALSAVNNALQHGTAEVAISREQPRSWILPIKSK
jgi:hypothetical protein